MPQQLYIPNLSMGLFETALALLHDRACPVYKKNIERREPPISHGESTPSSIAVLLITTGLDHHLSRLKYLRDHASDSLVDPNTPYFKWEMKDPLFIKVGGLLNKPREQKFKEQLLELTVVRDCVVHPKFYTVKDTWRQDDSWGKSSATFPSGVKHGDKATKRKRERSERTKILGLPMVSTWISYRDVVMCLIVVSRFLHLLERKYGNPYAHMGRLFVQIKPDGFFKDVENKSRRIVSFGGWTREFYNSLSPNDQKVVRKRLGASTLKQGLKKDTSLSMQERNSR